MNPIRAFRESMDLSLAQFAKRASVSRVAIQRTEAGVYALVPPKILSYMAAHPTVLEIIDLDSGLPDEVSLTAPTEIQSAYEFYQRGRRIETYQRQLLSHMLPPVGVLPNPSPIVLWRMVSGVASQLEFCKLLCVHPYPVSKLESGVQKKLPSQMLDALREAGYAEALITELSKRQAEYVVK